jgi:hypothetical protein
MMVKFSGLFYKPRTIFLLILLIGAVNSGYTQSKKKKSDGLGINVEVGLSTMYDDNVLKYSEKYLQRFLNREDEGRFHIKTYDDMVFSPSVSLDKSFKFIRKKTAIVNADFKYNAYMKNDINNWSSVSIGFRQNFARRASIKFYYSYIPNFYIRHFRDDDWVSVYGYTIIAFKPYSFSKDTYGFYLQNTFFKSSRVMFTFNYAKYFHNQHYTEYDSKNYVYRIKLFQRLNKNFRLELAYQFVKSDAKGYDNPGETKETSDDSDASYDEDGFFGGLIWYMPKVRKRAHNIKAEVVVYKRYYTTEQFLELDILHAGRVDDNLRLNFTYNLNLSKAWGLSAFYNYYFRDSGSSSDVNTEFISLEKDYRQNRIGIKITYSFKL